MTEKLLYKEITEKIIAAAMEVHTTLGPGFLEAVYDEAMGYEMGKIRLSFEYQKEIKIKYKNIELQKTYRVNYIVENCIIVENKATDGLTDIDQAQVFNYLKASGMKVALLFNFGKKSLEWKRIICEKYKK